MVEECCALCRAAATQRCAGCMTSFYCSREHQKADWQRHKKTCKPFKISATPSLGRHLVATRDIKPGEIVLKEVPLLAGPPLSTAPVCLGCYKVLTSDEHIECPMGCGWPLCSEKCAESAAHRPECEVTRNIRGDKVTVRNFMMTHPLYQSVTVLRCLFNRASNPSAWAKLSALESHCDKRKETGKYETERVSVAQFLRKFFKLEPIFTEEDILKMCGVIQVNGHEVPISEPAHVAVYDVTSLLEHDCVPNCAKSFTSSGDVIIRAARAISRDEHLSISYTDTLWGTANRRHHLEETKYFWCRCARCSDPSEFDTNYSAIKCRESGCSDYLLPENPLFEESNEGTDDDGSRWRCKGCNSTVSGLQVAEIIERVGQSLAEMEKGNAQACEKFLADNSSRVLHANHFYLTDVKLALAQLIGQDTRGLPGLEDQVLNRKMALCRQVIQLADILFPADVRVRGMLIFELHAVIAEDGRRKANRGEISPAELRERLLESKRLLEESLFLLKNEPDVLPEGKIAIQAKRNLKDLNVLLQTLHATIGDSPL